MLDPADPRLLIGRLDSEKEGKKRPARHNPVEMRYATLACRVSWVRRFNPGNPFPLGTCRGGYRHQAMNGLGARMI